MIGEGEGTRLPGRRPRRRLGLRGAGPRPQAAGPRRATATSATAAASSGSTSTSAATRRGSSSSRSAPTGLRGEAVALPLEATPFLDVSIARPADELPGLRAAYPDAARALVRCRVDVHAGRRRPRRHRRRAEVGLPEVLRPEDGGRFRPTAPASRPGAGTPRREFREAVIGYLTDQLGERGDAGAVLAAAEALIEEARA